MTDFKNPCPGLLSNSVPTAKPMANLRQIYGNAHFFNFRLDRADMTLELKESLSSYGKPTASLRQTYGRTQNSR